MAKGKTAKKRIVHFEPDNVDISVTEGTNLYEAAIAAGVHINASCGGNGVCGTCQVLIKKGEVESIRADKLSDDEYARGLRQACQSRVITNLEVYVPAESRLEKAILSRESKQVSEFLATGWRFESPLGKYFVDLPPPTLEDNTSDLSRLLRGLKQQHHLDNLTVDFAVVKKVADTMREGQWQVTVTTLATAVKPGAEGKRGLRLIDIEPANTRDKHYALAFDIGTTSVCGQLLDLNHGQVVAQSMDYNGQINYGEDVITRINYCQKRGGLKKLQQTVVGTINGIIADLVSQSEVNPKHIGHITVAGNTTMTQILLGLNPKYIRLTPYTPVTNFFPPVAAKSIGIEVSETVHLFAFPAVSSYVGGDIVSGIVGAGIYQRQELTFYMDIGTNGEIVVGNSDWMVTASCSAGPAFEGGGIKHGIVASEGAIEGFEINPVNFEPVIHTIGDKKPKGICGSGLINIIAGLLEIGVITPNGRFHTSLNTNRIRESRDGHEYVLAWAAETQIGHDIVITEVDIDNLVRAKAAMYAGCQTLVESVGLSCTDLEQVIIAGAFGSSIDIEKSITIGLLPDLPRDKFTFIGNGSLLGARLTSFSTDLLDDTRRVADMMTNIELSEKAEFMHNYMAAMFLPHTDSGEFPSVQERLSNGPENKPERRIRV